MTDLGFLADFMIPVIVGICLCGGYVIKKWVKDVDNTFRQCVRYWEYYWLSGSTGGSFRHPLF